MTKNKRARQTKILSELESRPTLRVSELATRLSVSQETIRRDLDALTREGLIDRTYGGAMRRLNAEPVLNERQMQKVPERQAIARAALPILRGAQHLMLGSGATTTHVARRIAQEMRDITVMNHSFATATALALNPTIDILMVPGRYHPSEGAMHGAETVGFLETMRADWAILGASGLSSEGPSDVLLEAGSVYAAMARRAERTMIVADASKFDLVSPSSWARWARVDVLVTDRAPGGALAEALEQASVTVEVSKA
ncbi:MAG: DeoR/GlpR family DNA-binding transcription regulator [Pseudomonadota bacterium]